MSYLIVGVLATVVTCLGFVTEITRGNITHIKHGREPNAGAAIFPNLPFGPLFVVTVAWLLDWLYPHLGFRTAVVLSVVYLPLWWRTWRRLNRELQQLSQQRRSTSE